VQVTHVAHDLLVVAWKLLLAVVERGDEAMMHASQGVVRSSIGADMVIAFY